MSVLSTLRDRLITNPVKEDIAKAMLEAARGASSQPDVFQVPIGFNSTPSTTNRRQLTSVDFSTLRTMSVTHETTRAAINVRKRQITQLEYEVVDDNPMDGETDKAKLETAKLALEALLDPDMGIRPFLDLVIEDLLVLDGMAVYKQRTNGGKLYRLIPIDAATIKLLVDDDGMRPQAPDVAFQQWIRSELKAELTTQDLIYQSMNPRTSTPYGLSPLESMVLTIDASLHSMLYNVGYLNDNNIPPGFISAPENWTVDQIKQYMDMFDSWVSGPKRTNRIFMLPSGAPYTPTSKPADFMFKDFFDFLDRRVCMLFDVTPQELGISLQQYKENADGQDKIQMRKGIKPLAQFLAQVFTRIIKTELGFPGLRFQFIGLDNRYDTSQLTALVPLGVIGVDEAREDLRLPKTGLGPAIIANGTATTIDDVLNPPAPPAGTTASGIPQVNPQEPTTTPPIAPAKAELPVDLEKVEAVELTPTVSDDLAKWERKAIKHFKEKGNALVKFDSDLVSTVLHDRISESLAAADSALQIRKIFASAIEEAQDQPIMQSSLRKRNVNRFLDRLERNKRYKQFQDAALEALNRQLEPFTQEETIGRIAVLGKADSLGTVGDFLESLDIRGLEGFLSWAGVQGGNNAYQKLGLDLTFNERSPKFTGFISDRSSYLIQSVDATTKDWLVRTIAEGKNAQQTNAEIASTIRGQMPSINSVRANMIANTEVAHAAMQTELSTYKDQGVEKKIWILSEDIGDECGENADAGAIGVDDAFPSGDDAPPAHPNCRCYLQAVFDDTTTSIGDIQQQTQETDLSSYEDAINEGDTQTLASLAQQHIDDPRFHIHESIPGLVTPTETDGIPVFHGSGNAVLPQSMNMFGNAFYVSRSSDTAALFGNVQASVLKLKPAEILTINSQAEYDKLVVEAIAKYPTLDTQVALPKYVQSLGYKAVEVATSFDPLGGIAVFDKSVIAGVK